VIVTDAAFARRRLEAALAMNTNPTLSPAQVDDLMVIAETNDVDGNTVYTSASLNQAASAGWADKAGLTSDQYDLGGGTGKTLTRSDWHRHCSQMADDYATGRKGVLGSRGRGGIGVIEFVSPAYTESEL